MEMFSVGDGWREGGATLCHFGGWPLDAPSLFHICSPWQRDEANIFIIGSSTRIERNTDFSLFMAATDLMARESRDLFAPN